MKVYEYSNKQEAYDHSKRLNRAGWVATVSEVLGGFHVVAYHKHMHYAPLDAQQRYSVPEAMAYLRISRQKIYRDINAGKIKTIKDGRRRYVPGSEIIRVSSINSTSA